MTSRATRWRGSTPSETLPAKTLAAEARLELTLPAKTLARECAGNLASLQRHLQGSATGLYPPCKDTGTGARLETFLPAKTLARERTGSIPPRKDTCEGRLDVSGIRPLTYTCVSKSTATIAGPAKEAESVQTVVCPNMTQEGCDRARLSSHPNDMGSAESQLGHKHI